MPRMLSCQYEQYIVTITIIDCLTVLTAIHPVPLFEVSAQEGKPD